MEKHAFAAERANIRDRYQRVYGNVVFHEHVECTGAQPRTFRVADIVRFRTNGMVSERIGVIVELIEMDDAVDGQGIYAIILSDDPHGRRQYRLSLALLQPTETT